MERKIEKICIFGAPCEINGFNADDGAILCKMTNEDGKELKFFIKSPWYADGKQIVYIRAKDIIEYGLDNLKTTISYDPDVIFDYYIKHAVHKDKYVALKLILNIIEWCDLLSKEQLEKLNNKLWSDISFLRNDFIKNEVALKNTLYLRQAVLDKIGSMKK